MNGKHHLMAGGAFAFAGLASVAAVLSVVPEARDAASSTLPGSIPMGLLSFGFYGLGLLLPDCDNPNSMLGRYFCIPVEHRTWTHTVWFMIPFMILGWFFHPAHWIWVGIFIHLLCDSVSKCGVCWFYPISKYKHFGGSGAKLKKRHFLCLYSSETGETIICAILWLLMAVPAILLLISCCSPDFAGMIGMTKAVFRFTSLSSWLFSHFG